MQFPNCYAKPAILVIKWELVFMQVVGETKTKGQIKPRFKKAAIRGNSTQNGPPKEN